MKFYVIGDVSVDHIHYLEQFPKPGVEMSPRYSSLQPGGAGGTIGVTLARLGHSVTLAARVGDDPFATVALSGIRESGVSESAIQTDYEYSTCAITVLYTNEKERAMISDGSANRRLDPAKFKKKDVETSDALVISAYSLIEGPQRQFALKAIEVAKNSKTPIPIFIDLGAGAVDKTGTKLLEDVMTAEYLTLNHHELLVLTGANSMSSALMYLGKAGMRNVAVKVGKRGSIVWSKDETELVDSAVLDQPLVDSTGTGDSFTGAFAHAIMGGKSLAEAARFANIAGALAATEMGAQSRKITIEDLEGELAAIES